MMPKFNYSYGAWETETQNVREIKDKLYNYSLVQEKMSQDFCERHGRQSQRNGEKQFKPSQNLEVQHQSLSQISMESNVSGLILTVFQQN